MFITIEGIEGSGKSTLIRSLALELKDSFPEVLTTYEPGATAIGKNLRNILLNNQNTAIAPQCELLLFAADRAQHVYQVIKPALSRDALVISDRYIHSTLAYQGYGRGLSLPMLETVNNIATAGLLPDLVILLDLEPEVGLARAMNREHKSNANPVKIEETSWTRFEQEELEFHHRIRQGFLKLADGNRDRFLVIDGNISATDILLLAKNEIDSRLKNTAWGES